MGREVRDHRSLVIRGGIGRAVGAEAPAVLRSGRERRSVAAIAIIVAALILSAATTAIEGEFVAWVAGFVGALALVLAVACTDR